MREIIVFGGVDWQGTVSLPIHHVVHRLANKNRIFYIDNFGAGRNLKLSDWRRALHKIGTALAESPIQSSRIDRTANISVHMPLVVPIPALQFVQRFNVRLLTQYMTTLYQKHDIELPVIWTRVATDLVLDVIRTLPRSLLVYQAVDYFPFNPSIPDYLRERYSESAKQLCQAADIVFVSARGLMEKKKTCNPNVHFLPNGVEVERFQTAVDGHPLLQSISRPIAGFAGNLGSWVNQELLAETAKRCSGVNFVLAGPTQVDVSMLEDVPNIHLIGPIPFASLPSLFRGFDVGIIPYRITEFTTYTFPSKLMEYLASGLPVVSTSLPELMSYANVATFADTPERFALALQLALDSTIDLDAVGKRIQVAQQHSWESLVNYAESEIDRCLIARS